jgi:acyl-CoA synthetase (AMP-forming)/AMP-acid ligase II
MNLYDTFKATAETYPDKIAVICKDTHLSYWDLLKRVDMAAAGFHGMGLKKGDRIGLMMQNCPEFIICFYAAMKLGLISVSINIMSKRHEVEYILKDSRMTAIVLNRFYLSSIADYDDQKIPMSDFYALTFYENTLSDILPYESLLKNSSVPSIADLSPGDPAVIAYTSGTTGFPKGAVHSHENILTHLAGIRDHLHFHEGDVFLAALPFFSACGLFNPCRNFSACGRQIGDFREIRCRTLHGFFKKRKSDLFCCCSNYLRHAI